MTSRQNTFEINRVLTIQGLAQSDIRAARDAEYAMRAMNGISQFPEFFGPQDCGESLSHVFPATTAAEA